MGKPKSYIGLDIGTSAIKLVEISSRNGGLAVTKLGQRSITPESDPTTILKEMFRGIKTREVISATSETFVVSRSFTFPAMSEEEFDGFLKANSREYLPARSRIEEVALDYQILREEKRGDEEVALVLIAASRKEAIHDHLDLLNQAGLVPSLIDASSIPLFNAFYRHPTIQSGKSTAIINLGARKTNVLLIEDKIIRSVTELPIGGHSVTEALVGSIKVSSEEAENLMRNSGDPPSKEILETMAPALESILSEIEKVFLYYQKSEGERENPECIILSGGACRISGLKERLGERFRAEVEVGDPFEGLTLKCPPPENPSSYALAVGLALKGVYPEVNTIDLLPAYYRDSLEVFRGKKKLKRYAVGACTGLLFALALISGLWLYFRLTYGTFEGKFKALRADLDRVTGLKAENERLKAKLDLIQELSRGRSNWSGILTGVNKAVPKELWLTDLTTGSRLSSKTDSGKGENLSKDYSLRVTGLSYSGERVKEFLSALEREEKFKNVELSFLEKGKENPGSDLVKFELRMEVVP